MIPFLLLYIALVLLIGCTIERGMGAAPERIDE